MDFQYIAWGARGSEFESRRSDQRILGLTVFRCKPFCFGAKIGTIFK